MELPLVTPDLPGTGGRVKSVPAHFVVEEIPLYEPGGAGEHVYLRIRREGRTTREVAQALAAAFAISERDVGCAGLKDKQARVTQTFSLPVGEGSEDEIAARAASVPGIEVLDVRRHGNKLRRGHLLGNRFSVLLAEPVPDALPRARAIAEALRARGLPNFFAEQRLGADDRNARRGRARLELPSSSWIARFELSAWQSALFNAWLVERLRRGWFDRIQEGDVAKKTDTGGLFDVLDAQVEQPRLERGEIVATGPIYGSKMRRAGGVPGELEREILAASGVDEAVLARARLSGSRRAARVFLDELEISEEEGGLRLSFRLPKGAYATNALREFVKAP